MRLGTKFHINLTHQYDDSLFLINMYCTLIVCLCTWVFIFSKGVFLK